MNTPIIGFGTGLTVTLFLCAVVNAQIAGTSLAIQRMTNSEVVLKMLNTQTSNYYRLTASTNLAQWDNLFTFPGSTSIQHTDSAAPYFNSRFYQSLRLDGAGFLTGDHLSTQDGDLIIHPINHATLVMSWNNKLIYVDPVGSASLYQGIAKADLILISHEHSDHMSTSTIESVRKTNTVIVTTKTVYTSLTTAQKGLSVTLTNGAQTNLLEIAIEAVPAYNLTTSNHPKGIGNGYVLTLGGRRIYISADTENTPEMLALKNIDTAFLCINTPYTMTVDKAASAVRAFRPKIVYPYHYRNADGTYTDLNSFKKKTGADLGIEVRIRKWY